jgi:hypothetical protein
LRGPRAIAAPRLPAAFLEKNRRPSVLFAVTSDWTAGDMTRRGVKTGRPAQGPRKRRAGLWTTPARRTRAPHVQNAREP